MSEEVTRHFNHQERAHEIGAIDLFVLGEIGLREGGAGKPPFDVLGERLAIFRVHSLRCRPTLKLSRGSAKRGYRLERLVGLHAFHTRTARVMRYSRPQRTLPSLAR